MIHVRGIKTKSWLRAFFEMVLIWLTASFVHNLRLYCTKY